MSTSAKVEEPRFSGTKTFTETPLNVGHIET